MTTDRAKRLGVLYLSSRPPFPPSGGREKIILQSLGFLVAEHDVDVIIFCGKNEHVDVTELTKMGCRSVTAIMLPGIGEVAFNVATRWRHALQENLFFSRKARAKVRSIAGRGVDVVIADMLRTGQYCDDLNLPKVVDLDDLLSERYEQFLANGHGFAVFGTFAKRIPKAFKVMEPLLRRYLLKREQAIVGNREKSAPDRFDVTLLTSVKEVHRLRAMRPGMLVCPNPQAVAIPNACWRPDREMQAHSNIFFLGNLRTSQNLASLKYITDEVMQTLIQRRVMAELHTVGDYDERADEATQAIQSRVSHHGFVSDYFPILRKCQVAVLPIVEGTGIKTKILDAMAMGIPIVTNELGIEGLDVKHGQELLIANSPVEMAQMIEVAVGNPDLCRQLSQAAREYVTRYHDPITLQRRFLEHISIAIEKGRARLSAGGTIQGTGARVGSLYETS